MTMRVGAQGRFLIGIGLVFLLVCCGLAVLLFSCDVVEQRFATYQDAVDAGALHSNSFIPPFAPKSATHIHDVHNPDTNTGSGSFRFDPTDAKDSEGSLLRNDLSDTERQRLKEVPGQREKAYKVDVYLLFVDRDEGTCRYWIERNQ